MNIFVLDQNRKKGAQYHCDQHVSKMILESVQIMCTCLNKKGIKTPYKSTHSKHPCVLWIDESYSNFIWLKKLALELNIEFNYRYERNKDHASINVLKEIQSHHYEDIGLTEFTQVMPVQYKYKNNPVRAYRTYYHAEKAAFATWTKRAIPYWMKR